MKLTNLRQFAVAATLILAASTSTQAQVVTNFFQAVTNLSPAAYWPLQETGQPPLADVETNLGSFGNIANAIYSSTNAIKAQPGVAGGYLSVAFVGGSSSGSFLGVPNASPKISLPVGPFSVEAWIYPSNLNNNLTIMAQAGLTATPGLNGTQSGAGWSLNQNYDPYTGVATPGWSFHVYNGVNIFGGADALVATNYSTNTWYHLVGVFDGTNATLYVDGVNATTASVQMSA
ncbi:MAG TPA: LamG domain-containing protein, partial [Candidatus Acidoferrales bacterium]|nr:LamG domain-containing protein [Candidatus Acidoferrales bacterium]